MATSDRHWLMQLIQQENVEDYSLRYAPRRFRRWSPAIVASAGLGASAALFPFAISAALASQYGSINALIGNLVAVILCIMTGIPIAREVARHNIDMDLLTRGAGFGYLGSTLTSLIYATFTLVYFAFEGAIMAQGVTGTFGIPLQVSYVIVALAVIPLVTFGMSFLTRFQAWSWPIWLVLLVMPIVAVATIGHHSISDWLTFSGMDKDGKISRAGISASMTSIGLVAASLLSLLAQIGEQADYLRFMPDRDATNDRAYRIWTFMAGPGWAIIFMVSYILGTYVASYTVSFIGAASNEPFQNFLYAYDLMVPHWLGLTLAFLLVVVAQAKINVVNAYSGSLSWSNFFSRVLHRHYGRFTWLVMQVLIGLALMEAEIFKEMTALLAFYSNVAVAWIVAVFADLTINREWLGLRPDHIEHKRGLLYRFNPVGFGSMVIASVLSIAAFFGVFGDFLATYSTFSAALLALVLAPLFALATQGAFYIKRNAQLDAHSATADGLYACTVCSAEFEPPDMLDCPFHKGPICSLCCTVESHCNEVCKVQALPADMSVGTTPTSFMHDHSG